MARRIWKMLCVPGLTKLTTPLLCSKNRTITSDISQSIHRDCILDNNDWRTFITFIWKLTIVTIHSHSFSRIGISVFLDCFFLYTLYELIGAKRKENDGLDRSWAVLDSWWERSSLPYLSMEGSSDLHKLPHLILNLPNYLQPPIPYAAVAYCLACHLVLKLALNSRQRIVTFHWPKLVHWWLRLDLIDSRGRIGAFFTGKSKFLSSTSPHRVHL